MDRWLVRPVEAMLCHLGTWGIVKYGHEEYGSWHVTHQQGAMRVEVVWRLRKHLIRRRGRQASYH